MAYVHDKELHRLVESIGMLDHAAAVRLLQLCAESRNAQVLPDASLCRIKDAIIGEIAVKSARSLRMPVYAAELRERLDPLIDLRCAHHGDDHHIGQSQGLPH